MTERFPGRRVREYIEMQREAELGYSLVQQALMGQARRIVSADSFLEYVRAVHGGIFSTCWGEVAGRFRLEGEEVSVGHDVHEFDGAAPDEIAGRLRTLWSWRPFSAAPPDIPGFARWAAEFTAEFFAIHPFYDGNGRTARFLIEAACDAVGLRIVQPAYPTRGEKTADRAQYLLALQYAHRCVGRTRAQFAFRSADDDRAPFAPLALWWEKRIKLDDLPALDLEWVASLGELDLSDVLLDDAVFDDEGEPLAFTIETGWLDAIIADLRRERAEQPAPLDERTLDLVLPIPARTIGPGSRKRRRS